MKLIDAMKHKDNPFWIPDCTRDDLPEFFKALGFTAGAEIGVWKGEFTKKFCEVGLKMYAIDPWLVYRDFDSGSFSSRSQARQDSLYEAAKRRLAPYPACGVIRKASVDAISDIPNRSLDFVYIDGNHRFGYIAMDLMKWTDKVRKGGVIAGHDYFSRSGDTQIRGVGPIVDAFAKSYDFTNWYVLGSKTPGPNEKTDDALSFVFFKHW
ncbi:hypothetical protein A3F62_01505 [Candidatus Woesebacteria bacterium RIFCSPHIGHO2_12_FULL_44_11]|uniref:Methyltransferase n=1 Tax=Candidatus Woesebacteria bacterium RIFCSPLOWO2_01_FULL_44_14 TaxID=1802525 RepID=A0A1F8BZ99_9BACT|nr:MAG: hypothetical protein A3F62_01505 [Candidatus Woesebacteria bacterium RIFCSPHIGHO2_12_FULL_44_11]OGM69342.1 MAG: hypothetical protein A2975_02345 [Candidatus Woesebacteria bacterium RIFCSPLOWO2_01_FULL_44_14]